MYNDYYLVKLIAELTIIDRLRWHKSKIAIFTHNQYYDITTPFNYLGLNFISLKNRLKLIKKLAFPKDNIASLKEFFQEEIYCTFIEDMLINKFNRYAVKINPIWFTHKLRKRGRSRCMFYERLGYIDGSFKHFCDKITEFVKRNGGEFRTNSSINRISRVGNQFKVDINSKEELFDRIIFTISPPDIANLLRDIHPDFSKKLFQLSFMSNITILLYTKRNFTSYYWINIADRNIGLTGIISQSNLITYKNSRGFFTYISLYLPLDSPINNLDSEAMIEYILKELNKMHINLTTSDIIYYKITNTEYAQPLYFDEDDLLTVNMRTPINGIYILNSHSLLPEDRGLNNIIQKSFMLSALI